MLVRITVMVLRVSALLALILGIIFWFNNSDSILPFHMLLGIIVTLSLWVLGFAIGMTRGGNWGLAAGAFVLGLIMIALGLTQASILPDSPLHWIIQVVHLLLGLSAIGLGEMIAGRYRRLGPAAQAVR